MTTIMLSLSAVAVVIAAQVVVLSSMFLLQMGDYQKLRNLGLMYKSGKRSVGVQILVFTVLGQLCAAALLVLGAKKEIEYFVNVVKYIEPADAVLLSITHLAAAVLVIFVAGRILKARVFAFTANKNELDLAELEQKDRKEAEHE